MKIYKIAQTQQFNILQPNPSGSIEQNLTIQIQNFQVAQQALQYLNNIANIANELKAKASQFEDELGVNLNLASEIDNILKKGISQTNAFNFLVQMNLLPSVDKLFDANFIGTINTQITKNIQSAQEQQAALNNMKQAK